jgi:4-hydroxy-tetrahydrodipicolinate reductase
MTNTIAIAGASGRMGQMLIDAVREAPDCTLAGALDIAASPAIGKDAGSLSGQSTGVLITSDFTPRAAGQPSAD